MEDLLAMNDTARRADHQRKHRGPVRAGFSMSQYRDTKVEDSEVTALQRELEEVPNESKIWKWMAFRHSAQLYWAQNQGYHHHFTNFAGAAVCTCGLEIGGDELLPLFYPNDDLDLQPLQLVAGHRNLPSCEGVTVALIVKLCFDRGLGENLWTAYCQVCGKSVLDLTIANAVTFVEGHNQSCQM